MSQQDIISFAVSSMHILAMGQCNPCHAQYPAMLRIYILFVRRSTSRGSRLSCPTDRYLTDVATDFFRQYLFISNPQLSSCRYELHLFILWQLRLSRFQSIHNIYLRKFIQFHYSAKSRRNQVIFYRVKKKIFLVRGRIE